MKSFDFIVILVLFVFISFGCAQSGGYFKDTSSDESRLSWARSLPREDIGENSEVADYLRNHNVYISLTSSPKRVKHLHKIFAILDLEHVKEIRLTVPKRYGRDNSTYVIPDEVRNFPKVKIVEIAEDLGPITKLIPTIQSLKSEPESIVITIDDDFALAYGSIGQLIKYSVLTDAVVGVRGLNLDYFGLQRSDKWLPFSGVADCGKSELTKCDMVEGITGIAYKVKHVDSDSMLEKSKLSKECRFSDDLVVMHTLAESQVPVYMIKNEFARYGKSLTYADDEHASWRGGGILNTPRPLNEDFNREKYLSCIKILNDAEKV
jgi:hypothetical protein